MFNFNKKQLILIGLTLALGLGLFGCGKKSTTNTNQNINVNQDQNTNLNTNTATTTDEIDTSDWKTYRNEEYGFEFKYPNDWFMKESSEKINFYDKEWLLETDNFRKKMISPQISISYYPNINDVTALIKKMFNLEKYPTIYDAIKNESDIADYGEKIINGKKINYILAGAELPYYFYFFPSQNNKGVIVFEISYTNKLRSYLLSVINF